MLAGHSPQTFSKDLGIKVRETKDFGADELACGNRHGLDYDRASDGVRTRLDVTSDGGPK
jgi:hypothetical protein